jgi:hypothetical protein
VIWKMATEYRFPTFNMKSRAACGTGDVGMALPLGLGRAFVGQNE